MQRGFRSERIRSFFRYCFVLRGSDRQKFNGVSVDYGIGEKEKLEDYMAIPVYPRSPKSLLGGIAHLGRFIDKIRLRNAGEIQDYNYITVGFDKYLVDFLQIDPKAFEQRVLAGGADEDLLVWVKANSRKPSDQEIAQWSQGILSSGPKDDAARQRFQSRLQGIATKRGVPVGSLPPVHTWADVIELDEERL